jgi:hypothetical protein
MSNKPPHILREVANGVIDQKGNFYPYRTLSVSVAGTIPVKAVNQRIFVKSISGTAINEGVVVSGKRIIVTATQDGVAVEVFRIRVPALQAGTEGFGMCMKVDLGVLYDANTAITYALDATIGNIVVTYAFIDEVEGEYSS